MCIYIYVRDSSTCQVPVRILARASSSDVICCTECLCSSSNISNKLSALCILQGCVQTSLTTAAVQHSAVHTLFWGVITQFSNHRSENSHWLHHQSSQKLVEYPEDRGISFLQISIFTNLHGVKFRWDFYLLSSRNVGPRPALLHCAESESDEPSLKNTK